MSNVDDNIDKILKDYRDVLTQQMGLILSGKHRLDIKTADKRLIDEPIEKLAELLDQKVKEREQVLIKKLTRVLELHNVGGNIKTQRIESEFINQLTNKGNK